MPRNVHVSDRPGDRLHRLALRVRHPPASGNPRGKVFTTPRQSGEVPGRTASTLLGAGRTGRCDGGSSTTPATSPARFRGAVRRWPSSSKRRGGRGQMLTSLDPPRRWRPDRRPRPYDAGAVRAPRPTATAMPRDLYPWASRVRLPDGTVCPGRRKGRQKRRRLRHFCAKLLTGAQRAAGRAAPFPDLTPFGCLRIAPGRRGHVRSRRSRGPGAGWSG
jgi:hypothetical protein